jgi:type VI secretion system protein ImpK
MRLTRLPRSKSLNGTTITLPHSSTPPERLTDANANIVSRRYLLSRQWPLWTPWLGAVVVLAIVYVLYAVSLNSTTNEVLRSLDAMLSR